MPQDIKVGIMLAVGVLLAVGGKRISVKEEDLKRVKESIARVETSAKSEFDKLDLPSFDTKSVDESVSKVKKDLEKSAEKGKEKVSAALSKDFPKDLRAKVEQTANETGDKAPVLELPDLGADELAVPEPPKVDRPPLKATKKEAKPTAPAKEQFKRDEMKLPPVRTKDVEKGKESIQEGLDLDLPKSDWLDESGLKTKSDSATKSSPSRAKSPRAPEDFPKPLPDADTYGAKPVHPYFKRFLKEGTYYVRDGDTLKDIAHNLYQDEAMAEKIIEANRDVLKSSKDLKAGLRLQLPQ